MASSLILVQDLRGKTVEGNEIGDLLSVAALYNVGVDSVLSWKQ